MDSKVVFKKTARLAVTAGLAASMTLGSFPVAVFADTAAEPAPKPAVEQEAPKADAESTEEQEAPKAEEKATETKPVTDNQTDTDQPVAESATTQADVNKAEGSLVLHGTITENLTIKTANLKVTAETGTVVKGNIRVEANGVSISGVTFELDSTKGNPAQSLVVSKASGVAINGNTFTIPVGATSTQLSSVWLEQGAVNTTISGNTFNLGQTNNSSVGINLVGNGSNPVTGTQIEGNTVNAGPLGTDLADPSSMMFVVGNGNTKTGYGITGLTVSNNKVYNKTGKTAVESKVWGVSVTASKGTAVTGNYFEGLASVGYSAWPNQGPNTDMSVSGNTFNTYTGFVMGNFLTEGGLTVGENTPGQNLNNMYNGSSPATTYSDPNGKIYSSVEAALNAGVTSLTLLRDTAENVVIPAEKTVTLDLNGHKLTNQVEEGKTPTHTITNEGTLTVKDSVGGGVVDNVSHQKAALSNAEGAKAVLDGGTFKRSQEKGVVSVDADGKVTSQDHGDNTYYTIDNQGDLTINDGTKVQLLLEGIKDRENEIAGYSSIIRNGEGDKLAKLTINGGTITGGKYIKNSVNAELTVNGGTIKGQRAAVLNYNVATITGGTFTTQDNGTPVIWNYPYSKEDVATGTLTITGGTFTATDKQYVLTQSSAGDATANGSITISGGSFDGSFNITGKPDVAISGGSYTVAPDDKYLDPNAGLVKDPVTGEIIVKEPELLLKNAKVTYDIVKGELKAADAIALVGAAVDVNPNDYQVTADASSLEALNAAIKAGKTGDYELQFMAAKKGAKAKAADAKLIKTATVTLTSSAVEPTPEPVEKFTVTFVDNFNKTSDKVSVEKGKAVAKPADPAFDGWKFEGWFTDAAAKSAYDFSAPVTGDMTLYAGYSKSGVPTETEPEETQKPVEKKSDGKALPQTGDDSALPMVAAAGAGAVAIAAGAVAMKRRKQE